jgi:hypothetical protein
MDLNILVTSLLSFIFFLILHTLIFRKVRHDKVLIWIVKTCLIGSIFPLLLSLIISIINPIKIYPLLYQAIIIFVISYILYCLFAVIYILGPFGLIESSLRLKLLSEIFNAGEKGIKYQNLLRAYNKYVIIQKRLDRFVASKDFLYKNNYYTIKNRFSYFIIQNQLFTIIKKLYLNNV